MTRTNVLDAAFLAAGITFIVFLLAQAASLLLHAS
jgi:hypothetical protein